MSKNSFGIQNAREDGAKVCGAFYLLAVVRWNIWIKISEKVFKIDAVNKEGNYGYIYYWD
ncbi:MAG: hypothetical protein HFI37_05250 [Lachnospiraceae bacterium]|nr:hypothetical protein [Lachnospiraceae bacterium]